MRSAFPADPTDALLESWHGIGLHTHRGIEEVLRRIDPGLRQGQLGGPQDFNNVNYLILGRLIEHVTGHPLAAVLRRDLIIPAGLSRV